MIETKHVCDFTGCRVLWYNGIYVFVCLFVCVCVQWNEESGEKGGEIELVGRGSYSRRERR